jgi:hypothetical protein
LCKGGPFRRFTKQSCVGSGKVGEQQFLVYTLEKMSGQSLLRFA